MDTDNLFRIGDMARLFNLSAGSIRHYERLKMLTPEYIDEKTGYRYYSPKQFEIFNAIRYLRTLDMPLEEIKDFLNNKDVETIEEKLLHQKKVVAEKQKELLRIEKKIDNRLRQLKEARNCIFDTPELVLCPACRIFCVNEPIKVNNYHDMEMPTSKLAKAQNEAVVFLGKVGVGISSEHLEQGSFDKYDCIFLLLEDGDVFEENVIDLPKQTCVRIRFNGSHTEAPMRYRMLMNYISENGFTTDGYSREITVIDYGITNNTEKFVTEIIIPVKKQG